MVEVSVADAGGYIAMRLPRWVLEFSPVGNQVRPTSRGPRRLWAFSLCCGPPPEIGEGDRIYRKCHVLALQWPVRLYWAENWSPSRAWTGRGRELCRVDYWTPRGWKCHLGNQP
jgi:hypothetical protein